MPEVTDYYPGKPGRDPDLTLPDTTLPEVTVTVLGTSVGIPGFDEDKRALVDELRVKLASIGLTLLETRVGALRPHRRWSHRRVSYLEVQGAIRDNPGIARTDLAWQLYGGAAPWSEEQGTAALAKLAVALHKLRTEGKVVFGYNDLGAPVVYPAGHKDAPAVKQHSPHRVPRDFILQLIRDAPGVTRPDLAIRAYGRADTNTITYTQTAIRHLVQSGLIATLYNPDGELTLHPR